VGTMNHGAVRRNYRDRPLAPEPSAQSRQAVGRHVGACIGPSTRGQACRARDHRQRAHSFPRNQDRSMFLFYSLIALCATAPPGVSGPPGGRRPELRRARFDCPDGTPFG
jgi:hypothetical protein